MSNYLSKAFATQSFHIPNPVLTEKNLARQDGRVFLITGGYAGIGQELSKILYNKGATVYVAGRSEEKGIKAIEAMKKSAEQNPGRLEFLLLDLNDLTTIKRSAEEFMSREQRLDVLINNAGVMFPPAGTITKQGHDMQFGTNCLGPFLFTNLLLPIISRTAASAPANTVRVLWAASLGIQVFAPDGGVVFDSAGKPQVTSSQQTNYGQTKVGNLLLAIELQKRLRAEGIISVSFNPGNLKTELQRHSGAIAMRVAQALLYPAVFGAYTELYAAISDQITLEKNISYVIPWGRDGNDLIRSDIQVAIQGGLAGKFWDWCELETRNFQ